MKEKSFNMIISNRIVFERYTHQLNPMKTQIFSAPHYPYHVRFYFRYCIVFELAKVTKACQRDKDFGLMQKGII